MKKSFSLITAYLCILSLLTLGAAMLLFAEKGERVSDTENRNLQAFPALTAESFFDGDFMDELENWLSDSFFARDRVVGASRTLLSAFSAPGDQIDDGIGDAQLIDTSAEEDEAPPAPTALPQASAVPASTPGTAATVPAADVPAAGTTPTEAKGAGVYLIAPDGSRKVYQEYSAAEILHLAEVLNTYRDRLGPDGRVNFINVPVSQVSQYLTDTGRYSGWESTLDEALQPLVRDGVYIYDAEELYLQTMFQEYDYLTIDHHWTALGASRAADAMLERMGLLSTGYYEYLYRLESEYNSDSSYDRAALEDLAPPRNDVQIPLPMSPVAGDRLSHLEATAPAPYLLEQNRGGYGVYLTGLSRGWEIFRTGFHTGRRAFLLGDCYCVAFLPYLTPFYDSILMTDVRDGYYTESLAGASIQQYMDKYGADDIFIVTCTWTPIGDSMLQDRLLEYLDKDYG